MAMRHGHARVGDRSNEYKVWVGMIQRCTNDRHKSYPYYGGRGISVCSRWLNSFVLFYADMGKRPSPKHTLDRLDNDGNYEPGNCQWSSPKVQHRNKCSNRRIKIGKREQTVAAWAEELGIEPDLIYHRLGQGWSEQEAVTTPVEERLDDKTVLAICKDQERGKTLTAIAEARGLPFSTVQAITSGRNRSDLTGRIHTAKRTNVFLERTPALFRKLSLWEEQGLSKREMARRLGVSRTVVNNLLLESN